MTEDTCDLPEQGSQEALFLGAGHSFQCPWQGMLAHMERG